MHLSVVELPKQLGNLLHNTHVNDAFHELQMRRRQCWPFSMVNPASIGMHMIRIYHSTSDGSPGITTPLAATALLPAARGAGPGSKLPRCRPSTQGMQQSHILRDLQCIPVQLSFPAPLDQRSYRTLQKGISAYAGLLLVCYWQSNCLCWYLCCCLHCDGGRLLQTAYRHVKIPPRPGTALQPLYPRVGQSQCPCTASPYTSPLVTPP